MNINSNHLDSYAIGKKAAFIGMIASGLLAFIKISGGLISGSTSLTADGVESASDMLASAIIFGGMSIAQRPPDGKFPYGYGRAENLAAKTTGTILLMSAVLLITHSVHKLFSPAVQLPAWTLLPLALSFIVKLVLAFYKYAIGKKIRSSALKADAANDSVDILSALVAAIAIILNLYDHEKFAYADAFGGLGISVIVFYLGYTIFRETSRELMDSMPKEEIVESVTKSSLEIFGVRAVEKCIGRKSGTYYFFDLHIEVEESMTVRDAHDLGHRVKDHILQNCDYVKDVLVHVEPYNEPL